MRNMTYRRRLLATTLFTGAALAMASSPALAQDQQDEDNVGEVVVTGSRIVRQDFTAISPVTTVTSEQIEMTSTLTVESLLNDLPQVVAGNMRTSNNAGGEDFATVDLRGLGPQRTLVLINGERVPASSTTGVVDLNTIPASLISRVEVVTGGASAVYGSDALSGVVNFVLKDDYEGGELSMTYGSAFDGNSPEFEINGLFGGSFANGRGNLTAYAGYYNRGATFQDAYDYSRTSGAICIDSTGADVFVCDSSAIAAGPGSLGVIFSGGSGTPPWGLISNNAGNPFNVGVLTTNPLTVGQFTNYDHNCNPLDANRPAWTGGNLTFNDAGQLTPQYSAGACAVPDRAAGSTRYNFAPDNYLITPSERFNITTVGHYDITDNVRLRVQMSYANSWQQVSLAPTPATGLTVTLTPAMQTLISTNHPDLWVALQSRPTPLAPFGMVRRTSEVGTRIGEARNNTLQLMSTLTGEFNENWDWSLTASYGQVNFVTTGRNSINATAFRQGLAGCQDAAGNPLGVNALPGCVPLDIFGPGTLTPAMQSFLRVNTFATTDITESRIAGFVRGNLFELPAGPVSTVVGIEWRESEGDFRVDDQQRTGNIYGFNAIQDQGGAISVSEIYTEVAIPLLAGITGADYLGLELGYRYSNYNTAGGLHTYKIGMEWTPVDFLTFRAIYNSAVRAPSVFELYQNGDQGFPGYTDPCAVPAAPTAPTLAFCSAQNGGFSYVGFNQPNSQVEAFAFGNPNLSPETSTSFTAGAVIQPDFWPVGRLRAAVDYYKIEIDDIIASFGAQYFIDDCYDNLNPANPSCARVVRDPVTGEIDYVNTSRGNQGTYSTSGIDVNVDWSVDLGDYGMPGRVRVQELYSYVNDITINGTNYVDTTSSQIGGANYRWRNTLTMFYDIADWSLMGRWVYTPGMIDDIFGTPDHRTPAASYIDVSARWNVTDSTALTFYVGNLLNDFPPQTVSGTIYGQANTDVQVYRVLGRTFSINLRQRF